MLNGQNAAMIGKYHQYMINFLRAADRSFSPAQSAVYKRYAKRMANLISDLQKAA